MRQVGQDELVNILQSALRKLKPSAIKGLTDWRPTERLRARVMAAQLIAQDLKRLEILADAPEPPPFRYPDLKR